MPLARRPTARLAPLTPPRTPQGTTLLPGTVILTGTPAGVGYTRDPPMYLKHGDEVSVEIEQIGFLENLVVEEGWQA